MFTLYTNGTYMSVVVCRWCVTTKVLAYIVRGTMGVQMECMLNVASTSGIH